MPRLRRGWREARRLPVGESEFRCRDCAAGRRPAGALATSKAQHWDGLREAGDVTRHVNQSSPPLVASFDPAGLWQSLPESSPTFHPPPTPGGSPDAPHQNRNETAANRPEMIQVPIPIRRDPQS